MPSFGLLFPELWKPYRLCYYLATACTDIGKWFCFEDEFHGHYAGEEELKRVRLSHHSLALPRWGEFLFGVFCGFGCWFWCLLFFGFCVCFFVVFLNFSPPISFTQKLWSFLSQWKGTGLAS